MNRCIPYETLQNLGVKDKPVITVFNKIDRMEDTWVRETCVQIIM